MENLKEIELNYLELAFIMTIPTGEARNIFQSVLQSDKITKNDLAKVSVLYGKFKNITSLDARYDGQNSLLFYLTHKKASYKNYINDKSCIKQKKLTGGKSIFYKILDQQDLDFLEQNLKYKWDFLYKKK